MVCQRCGTKNPKGARACIHCGAELVDEKNRVPVVNVTDNKRRTTEDTYAAVRQQVREHSSERSKAAWGFLAGLLLNFFGFFISFRYEKYSLDRKTFNIGCAFGFLCQTLTIVLGVVFGVFEIPLPTI